MPATGRDRNDSSSEEESEDEVIIQPRRRASGFRVLGGPPAAASPAAAATPQEAKSAVLGQIQNMANQQQANEVVVAAPVVAEKTAEEKRALEERQRMLQQQQIAKAQQAAAIQAAAARVAQAHSQNIGTNQAEVEAKEQAARAQAEAERRGAEARQAQAKALQAAQEQTKRAQEEAARKAQEAKVRVEEQARAVKQQQENFLAAQKAQVEAQARAQAEANARADAARKAQQEAQARAQLETQAKIEAAKKAQAELQAKAQAEAQARTQALKAQQDAQIRANAQAQVEARAKAEAQAKAQAQARAQAEAQARTKAQAEAQARAKAQAEAQSKAQLQAKGTQARPNQQQQQQVVPDVKSAVSNKNTRVVPAIPQKSQAQQNIASSHSKPGSSSTGMLDLKKESLGSSPSSELQTTGATLIHHAPRPTGQKPTWNPPVRSVPQKDLGPLDTNGQLKQTAKAQEDQLSISEIRAAPPTLGISSAQLPSIRQENVVEKFVEKQDEQSLKEPTQRAGVQMLAGADRWERDSAIREQQATTMGGENTEKPAAVRLQDDACWMTQHRQPVEIQPPQVGKVTIPELSDGHVVQKTVIVTKPQSYQKVKWNEFPEEVKPEIGQAPKVQTQDWTPVNQEAQEMQRSLYKPARISRVWPPPEETLEKETAPMSAVKASDDCGWIQQEQNEVLRSAAWSSAAKINRVWPPPEEDGNDRDYSGPQHMPAVQWPPSESEQHEREQVEVLQKHLPTKKIERQWPPPPPQYQEVQMNEVITNQESHATQATAQATQQGVLAK